MKYLPLVFAIGCTTSASDPTEFAETVVVEAVTACPAGQWCIESSPATAAATLLHSVWAVSAEDVFAVGDDGMILRRTGDVWAAMASPVTANLRGVWAASSSDAWAGGVAGTILHFDGATWTQVAVPTTADIDGIWGSGPSDVWFCGSGTVLHWNGTAFSTAGFAGVLLSISGTGPGDVWATGENSNLRHWNGTSWTTSNPISGTATFFAVLAVSPTDVWVTDFMPGKETGHWNGVKWTPLRTGSGIFNGLSALAPADIWGAGGSRVGHWNGTAWTTEQPFGSNVALWSVATPPGNVWIVGSGGLIAHRSL
jgi:hypothetical protein